MTLPQDPYMLLSFINTMLRDKYSSLSELADDAQLDMSVIKDRIGAIGYTYDEDLNKFI